MNLKKSFKQILTSNFDLESNIHTVSANNIKTILNVPNYSYHDATISNFGGISVGSDDNSLYAVKSGDERTAVLYYFANIYDTAYVQGTEGPLRIIFPNSYLAHANSMTVDDDYIYIAMWGDKPSNEDKKNKIMRIKRKYVPLLKDEAVVHKIPCSNDMYEVTLKTGKKVNFCQELNVTYSDGDIYPFSITQIAVCLQDKANGITKFIMNAGMNLSNNRNYTIATLKQDRITVEKDEYFTLTHKFPKDMITSQDIFYDSEYGLYVLFWAYNGTSKKGSPIKNYIVRYNINPFKNNVNSKLAQFEPSSIVSVHARASQYKKYEIESLAFVCRDQYRNKLAKPQIIFSVNSEIGRNSNIDSVEEIIYNSKDAAVVNLYSSFWEYSEF